MQLSSSNRLEMRGKRVEHLKIENAENKAFLFLFLHSLMISIIFLLILVITIIFSCFVIGYYAKEEMQSFG